MRVPIGTDGWHLCDCSGQLEQKHTDFRGTKTLALQWADMLRHDHAALGALRRHLGRAFPPLTEDQIVREAAWRVSTGEWYAERLVIERVKRRRAESTQAPAALPKPERRAPAPPPRALPDPPLFPDDIDPVAIAAAQKQAAELGVPFCEECLRAQMAST